MSIYRYSDASTIREAVFHYAKNRPTIALLSAADNAKADELTAARQAFEAAGWQSIPVYVEGKPSLQVTGFKSESELDNFLRERRFTEGQAAIIHEPGDNPVVTSRERVQNMSLRLTGWFNILGNALLMVDGYKKHSGKKERDYYRMAGGGLLLAGAANLARYGNAKPEHYTKEVTLDLAQYIREQGGTIPPGTGVPDKGRSLTARVENFLYRNPAQVTLGVDSIGAASNLLSGIINRKSGGKAFGINSLGLKLAALLIPEQSRDEKSKQSPPHGLIAKAVDWIREKPLRFYGLGSLISDASLGMDAYQHYTPGKMDHIFTAGAAVSYTIADLLVAVSSKNHVNADGKFDADEQRAIEALAAQAIADQPEQERLDMAQKVGNFLVKRKEMRGDAGSISKSILDQASHAQQNPWVSRISENPSSAPAR